MIWFACKQCGKRHGRDDSLAGTLVFCDCGQGNRVPWSSTVPEPEPREAQPAEPLPRRAPRWEEEPEPIPRRGGPREEPEREPYPPPRRPPRFIRKPRPEFCFHHDEEASEATCEACRLSFCSACVVTIRGQTLCGPCKNFRIRGLNRPPRMSPLAIVALVLSLVSGPVTFILSLIALGTFLNPGASPVAAVFLCLLSIALPATALVLGVMALRDIDSRAHVGGRALAMTGSTAALAGVVWGASLACLMIFRHLQG
jgi:hypothetical protein